MKITVSTPMPEDYKSFDDVGLNGKLCLLDCVKLLCQDEEGHTAYAFLKQKDFEQFGLQYFEKYARLEYSKCCREWFMMCSKSPWYNDLERFPETVINVEFIGIENGTGREIYRGLEDRRYYLREALRCQKFAKWYVCGKQRMPDDGDDPKPNTIFQFGDQKEKVVYDDWNGVAAYEYNEGFFSERRKAVQKNIFIKPKKIAEYEKLMKARSVDYQKHNIPRYRTLERWTADFGENIEMDISVCSGDSGDPLWSQAVLYQNGHEIGHSEAEDYLAGVWAIVFNGITYTVKVCKAKILLKEA